MDFKKINLSEDTISMILGLAIVLLVIGLIFGFFQRKRGNVSVPGVTQNQVVEEKGGSDETTTNPQNTQKTYVVKRGDSLWKIAQSVYGDGNKWVDIAKENNIKNPGVIHSDLELKLPEIKKEAVSQDQKTIEPKNSEYTVVKGDNLWKISVAQYGDGFVWPKVYQANKILLRSPDKLEIGMKLKLPKVGSGL